MNSRSARPVPNFHYETTEFTTRKFTPGRIPGISSVPKAPPRSCPVPRIVTLKHMFNPPKPISFREDSDNTFISDSLIYSDKKREPYFNQCFTIVETLGSGSFGEVYKVISKEDGKVYACKKTIMKYKGYLDRDQRLEEVKKLEQLPPHKNCVKFYRAWEEDQRLYFLTEVCRFSLLETTYKRTDLNITEIWSFLIDILQGLHHLHKNNLVHMDVKPDNIFIGEDNLCKIGDFGLVVDVSQGMPSEVMEGDSCYLAPECLQNIYSTAADMFSLGMLVLGLATKIELPNRGPQWHELRSGRLPTIAQDLPTDLKDLLVRLIDVDPTTRITAAEALNLFSVKKRMVAKRLRQTVYQSLNCVQKMFMPLFLACFYLFTFIFTMVGRNFVQLPMGHDESIPADRSIPVDTPNLSTHSMLQYSDEENDDHSLSEELDEYCVHPFNSTPMSHSKLLPSKRQHFANDDRLVRRSVLNPIRNGVRSVPSKFMCTQYSPQDNLTATKRFQQAKTSSPFNRTSRNLLSAFSQMDSDDEDDDN